MPRSADPSIDQQSTARESGGIGSAPAVHLEAASESLRKAITSTGNAATDADQLDQISRAVGEMSLLVGLIPHLLRQLAVEATHTGQIDGLVCDDTTRSDGRSTAEAAGRAMHDLGSDLSRLTTGRRSPLTDAQLAMSQLRIALDDTRRAEPGDDAVSDPDSARPNDGEPLSLERVHSADS